MSRDELTELGLDDEFAFSCHPGISCFNACCRDLNQFLMPYDILRLKQHLSMTATDFLARYTHRHIGPQTGLPVVTLKPVEPVMRVCPFVTDAGCSVYDNRPSSCRIYPLVRLLSRSRETGELTVRYMLLEESHCNGFDGGGRQTVRQWIADQGLQLYNEMNDAMMAIISLTNQSSGVKLPEHLAELLDIALYDVDGFRRLLIEGRVDLTGAADLPPDPGQDSDEDLLRFAMQLVALRIRQYGAAEPMAPGQGK